MSKLTVMVTTHVGGPSNLFPFKWPERVMIESPLGGDYQRNLEYARLCLRHSMLRCNEAPMAFHLLYPQALCDDTDEERSLGIEQSFHWHKKAQKKVFYLDRGFSAGMAKGLEAAIHQSTPVEFRSLSMDAELVALMESLNSTRPDRIPVMDLSKKLLARREQDFGELAQKGDISCFRKFHQGDLTILERLRSEPDVHRQFLYPRVLMRDSLMHKAEAPLAMELLINQLVDSSDPISTSAISRPWELMADTVIVGVDAGINQAMVERCNTLLAKGANLELRSLANNPSLDAALERINAESDPDDRVGELIRNWKPIMEQAGRDPHAHTVAYQIERANDLKTIARLNQAAYSSRERTLEDDGHVPV